MSNYRQVEAFCLMEYTCEQCKKIEMLWNSRDAVTPFCVSCACGGEMRHTHWEKDKRLPNHQPTLKERVFVDTTREDNDKCVRKQIEAYWNHGTYPMSTMFADKDEAMKSLTADWSEEAQHPFVITGKEWKDRQR